MMKFERTLEDGQYEIWRSTNHADPKRFAEITLDWDNEYGNLMVDHQGMYTAAVVTITESGHESFLYIGDYETKEEAVKHLECEVSMKVAA